MNLTESWMEDGISQGDTCKGKHKHRKIADIHASSCIRAPFERAKSIRALDRAATVIGVFHGVMVNFIFFFTLSIFFYAI
jgi:hypothetical protein